MTRDEHVIEAAAWSRNHRRRWIAIDLAAMAAFAAAGVVAVAFLIVRCARTHDSLQSLLFVLLPVTVFILLPWMHLALLRDGLAVRSAAWAVTRSPTELRIDCPTGQQIRFSSIVGYRDTRGLDGLLRARYVFLEGLDATALAADALEIYTSTTPDPIVIPETAPGFRAAIAWFDERRMLERHEVTLRLFRRR